MWRINYTRFSWKLSVTIWKDLEKWPLWYWRFVLVIFQRAQSSSLLVSEVNYLHHPQCSQFFAELVNLYFISEIVCELFCRSCGVPSPTRQFNDCIKRLLRLTRREWSRNWTQSGQVSCFQTKNLINFICCQLSEVVPIDILVYYRLQCGKQGFCIFQGYFSMLRRTVHLGNNNEARASILHKVSAVNWSFVMVEISRTPLSGLVRVVLVSEFSWKTELLNEFWKSIHSLRRVPI